MTAVLTRPGNVAAETIFTDRHTAYRFTSEPVSDEEGQDLRTGQVHPDGMAVNNAWLQSGGFILAVRAAGLDAGPMGGIDAAAIDREFFAGSSLRTILVVNIGHATEDGIFPRNPRLGFDQAVTLT